jgi:prevent-host-death family protein
VPQDHHGHIILTILRKPIMPRQPARTKSARGSATISASAFKATCLELMDEIARTDADVIVTKHGRPVVRVSAVQTPFESPWGFIRGSVVSHGDIISPDHALWDASVTEPLASRPPD